MCVMKAVLRLNFNVVQEEYAHKSFKESRGNDNSKQKNHNEGWCYDGKLRLKVFKDTESVKTLLRFLFQFYLSI